MKFQSIKTFKLNKKHIYQILRLKDSHWKFGYKSQKSWFEKKISANDFHNLMIINNEIVGYTLLGSRSLFIYANKSKAKKLKYTLFSTLILKKKFRNYFYASKMMKFNNKIILRLKKPSFLICKKTKINFYKFYKWKLINKKNFLLKGHNTKLKAMIYNLNADVNCKYVFYFNF